MIHFKMHFRSLIESKYAIYGTYNCLRSRMKQPPPKRSLAALFNGVASLFLCVETRACQLQCNDMPLQKKQPG